MPPRTIGRYEVLSVIGRGGVGTVYRARHRDTGHPVAIKLLAPPPACEANAARRLAREFEALRGLRHPNVVHVHEAGVHEGYSFLAMELVDGLDLRSYLSPAIDDMDDGSVGLRASPVELIPELEAWSAEPETRGMLSTHDNSWDGTGIEALREFAALMAEPDTDRYGGSSSGDEPESMYAAAPATAPRRPVPAAMLARLNQPRRLARLRDVMLQVCDGLAYVHRHGLVHRDLKPSNIMVDDARRARIMDFGLVKLADDPDEIHCVVGTYLYMAPEQAHGDAVDARSDLYSLGVVLFELLCGRPPFTAPTPEELWKQITVLPPPPPASLNPGVDPELAHIAERLLAKQPRDRFQSTDELAEALRGAAREGAVAPP